MLSKLGIQLKKCAVAEVDYWKLCTQNIRDVEDIADRGNLLNRRQCEDLSSKLSKVIPNIRRLVSHCGASRVFFQLALEKLYRHAEKAKALVSSCGDEDWATAAIFQIQNENAFREILLDIGLCYNAIYEQAKCSSGGSNNFPEDLRLSSLFSPASENDTQEDQQELERRLEEFANGPSSASVPAKEALKECLAKYLLLKLKHGCEQSEASALDIGSAILWAKEREPAGTWGRNSHFLGAGSGGSGVCKTKWMGIHCAKKEFDASEHEATFLKEAGILAHLNHPCIVKFFCCGNEKMGKLFIAMELMEKSLLRLIEDQKKDWFPMPIAVDLMVQMARGMCYLHDQGIAHRDLKPLNVVVSMLGSGDGGDQYCVKLVDFGMSKTKVEASKLKTMSGFGMGTTRYKAPEVYRKAHLNGEGKTTWLEADVFSFAMTCAHVLSLRTPFGDMGVGSLYHGLVNGTRPELPTHCPKELVELLQACWDINPSSRPHFMEICTRLEILQHKLLRGFASMDEDSQAMDFDGGFGYIKEMVRGKSSTRRSLGDGVGDEAVEIELSGVDEVEEEWLEVDEIGEENVASVMLVGQETVFGVEDNGTWLMQDYTGDGKTDLIYIKTRNTGTNMVEVHVADAASRYQSYVQQTCTCFSCEDNGVWTMSSKGDLVFIKTRNTGSGKIEYHVASKSSNYQQFTQHVATVFGVEDNGTWLMQDYTGDGKADLVYIKTRNTGTNMVEVHVADAASRYQSYVQRTDTCFSSKDNGVWTMSSKSDLVFIKTRNTGSGKIEYHVASKSSNYQQFTQHVATNFVAEENGTWCLAPECLGVFADLYYIKTKNTGGNMVEVNAVSACSR